jgi:thiamine-monophosphate kinase
MGDASGGGTPSLHELGEFGLIERLARLVPGSTAVVGIGDDAAVLDMGGPDYLLATVDMLVEGVHFDPETVEPHVLGRRALAINVSDIAAMGGEPSFALISLALPPKCSARFLDQVYEGLAEEAALTSTGIVGGNVTGTSGPLCIDVTLLGRVPRGEVVLRSGAQPGDFLVVTGHLGGAAGLRAAAKSTAPLVTDGLSLVPVSRVAAARALASAGLAHAMMDLSDGLAGDLHHLCRASNVGAVVWADRLPISGVTGAIATSLGISAESLALTGGEDYELLIALSARDVERAQIRAGDVALTVIGEIVDPASGVTLLTNEGVRQELPPSGWTHF